MFNLTLTLDVVLLVLDTNYINDQIQAAIQSKYWTQFYRSNSNF